MVTPYVRCSKTLIKIFHTEEPVVGFIWCTCDFVRNVLSKRYIHRYRCRYKYRHRSIFFSRCMTILIYFRLWLQTLKANIMWINFCFVFIKNFIIRSYLSVKPRMFLKTLMFVNKKQSLVYKSMSSNCYERNYK